MMMHDNDKDKPFSLKSSKLSTRLILWLIPPLIIILLITGKITYLVSQQFLNTALDRFIIVQTMGLRNEIEQFLDQCRRDLQLIAQKKLTPEMMRDYLASLRNVGGIPYREFAYISQKDDDHWFFVAKDEDIQQIPMESFSEIRPNPLLFFERISSLSPNEVWISHITEVEHPFPSPLQANRKIFSKVIQFATPYSLDDDEHPGYLILSVDTRLLRNILSIYNSPQSPIYPFQRSSELRYSYLFDNDGWILCQSEDPEKLDKELTTDLVRTDFTGTLGKPGMPSAFRPSSVYKDFWKMVGDLREGKQGLIHAEDEEYRSELKEYTIAYSPIRFKQGKNTKPFVYCGVAFVDRSRLTLIAGYKHIDAMFIITFATICIISLMIYILGQIVTKPIMALAKSVSRLRTLDTLEPIRLPYTGYEILSLQSALNDMIDTMTQQMEEIQIKDREIEIVSLREIVPLEDEFLPSLREISENSIPEIVGFGSKIDRLKTGILKAAKADVDVLIIGETGTGKQLTAEAIHQHSLRCSKPFISINCGELDENLLLDTLFGHVKGAYTEAKTDRKGAFLEANGGTLFLDEIQTASLSVQQALLRAIAMRKIKPLGNDKEHDVDVRLIAATNVDLTSLIEKGSFRNDLFFRLQVITIYTPPLRDLSESIPMLVSYYLKQAEKQTDKQVHGISRGALEKMKHYNWPGNIRELKNCITRAVVMSEDHIIQADDIIIETDAPNTSFEKSNKLLKNKIPVSSESVENSTPIESNAKLDLNSRQEKALPIIREKKVISRTDYQKIIGDNLPSRTAISDLQDMMKKGILKKDGQGRATRYVITV